MKRFCVFQQPLHICFRSGGGGGRGGGDLMSAHCPSYPKADMSAAVSTAPAVSFFLVYSFQKATENAHWFKTAASRRLMLP